jgi:Ca2+/Na+ antiporter
MKRTTIDILKAIALTLAGILTATALVAGLRWIAEQTNIDGSYIVGAILFLIVVYANYQLIKLSK